jgi:CheY-like chemotaxis protein
MQLTPANLNEIVAGVGKFLKRIIGEDISMSTTLNNDPLKVNVDRGQVEQVLMNLATNARDAMQQGGMLSIETELQEIDNSFVESHGFGAAGRYAVMVVSDNGCGMDEATKSNIFDPFFTTKEMGKGTGLGMSIVHGIIAQHKGFINIYSEVGVGTTFRIYVPLFEDECAFNAALLQAEPLKTGSETILLVEDDQEVRNLVNAILTSLGYTVITAVNGEDGVDKFRANQDRIQLTLMDVVMPKKSGKQAYDEIRQLKADAKILFTSGYTVELITRQYAFSGSIKFLMKPIKTEALATAVRETLDMTVNQCSAV